MLAVEPKPLARLIEDNLEALMHAHWRECSIDQERVPLDPDWTLGETLERNGVLLSFGLYRYEHLVGYSIFEVSNHLHFKSTKYAYNSGSYVAPEHRGFAGAFLASRCEELLCAAGVKKIVYSAPNGSALGPVLERSGYKASEIYYTKLVG